VFSKSRKTSYCDDYDGDDDNDEDRQRQLQQVDAFLGYSYNSANGVSLGSHT